jgi:hypothetical protein
MKLRTLDIPDDASRLAAWLDEQLASYYLLEIVTEMLALRDLPMADPSPVKIAEWLGQRRDAVLARGHRRRWRNASNANCCGDHGCY